MLQTKYQNIKLFRLKFMLYNMKSLTVLIQRLLNK